MEDPNLSDVGREQLKTDRKNFFPQAPFSPDIFNVPSKPDATSDTDNYRNDLLKQYCKNVSAGGGRYDTAFDVMTQYGTKKKDGAKVSGTDIDSAINEVTKDTTDAVGQIKYLLCQQADGLIAPPLPTPELDSSKGKTMLEKVYSDPYHYISSIFFTLFSFILIGFYLYQTYQAVPNKGAWWFVVIVSIIFFGLCLGVLFTRQCMDGENAYYKADDSDSATSAIWTIFSVILGISVLCLAISKFSSGNTKVYALYFGLLLPLILALAADMLGAVFWPQYFIIAVIILRLVYYSIFKETGWPIPVTSIYSRFAKWFYGYITETKPTLAALKFVGIELEVPNQDLFGAFGKG